MRSSKAGVAADCGLLGVGTGNQTWMHPNKAIRVSATDLSPVSLLLFGEGRGVETRPKCVAQAGTHVWIRLALNSQISFCLCLTRAEFKGMSQRSAVLGFVVDWGGVSLCSPGWLELSILLPLLLNADITG